MIRPAGPNRRYGRAPQLRRGLGALGGSMTVTAYPAPTGQAPDQIAVTGLSQVPGWQTSGEPMFYRSRSWFQQQVDSFNSAASSATGVMVQVSSPQLLALPDSVLCPLMSHGCVTQAQIGDSARISECANWNWAHPETMGTGIPSAAYCQQYNPFAGVVQTTTTITVIWASNPYPGYGAAAPAATNSSPAPTATSSSPAPTPTATSSSPTPTPTPATTGSTQGSPTPTPTTGSSSQTPADQPDTVGDPNGSFLDQVISNLPASLQPAAQQLYLVAGTVPVWGWGALLIVIVYLLTQQRKRGNRR